MSKIRGRQRMNGYSRYLRYLRGVLRASRYYDRGVLDTLRQVLNLSSAGQFSPQEMFLLGLLEPGLAESERRKMCAKARLLATQLAANREGNTALTENKLEFFKRCREEHLATPNLLALCKPGGEAPQGIDLPLLEDATLLRDFLAARETLDFVLKPVAGVHGEGVRLLRWEAGSLKEGAQLVDPVSLFRHMAGFSYKAWMLQERLYAHRNIFDLSGSEKLQTARVVTIAPRQGEVQVPIAYLRIICGDDPFDNFNFGTSGNLVATVDLGSGRLKHVLGAHPSGFGIVEHRHHPLTGQAFEDFCLPHAAEVVQLVQRAARAFRPLCTIGWDVAITDAGPLLMEGNVTWDPLPTREDLEEIRRLAARAGAAPPG